MENDLNQIDELYRRVLQNHTQKASVFAWARMRWRLFWISYYKYIVGIGTATVIILAIYLLTGTGNNDLEKPASEQYLTENKGTIHQTEKETGLTENNKSETEASAGISNSETVPAGGAKSISSGAGSINTGNKAILHPSGVSSPKNTTVIENTLPLENAVVPETVSESSTGMAHTDSRTEISSLKMKDLTIHSLTGKSTDLAALDTGLIVKIPYDVKLKKNRISIGLYVSPAYTAFSLKAGDDYKDHLQYRNDHESPAISVSAGASVRLNLGNWYIQTGLEYNEFRQYRNYNNSFEALDSLNSYFMTDTIWGWVFDPPDLYKPIILGYDTVFVPVYNTTNEGYNRWKYLEVPLLAGYKFNRGRMGFEVGTGFSCGFFLGAQDNVPDLNDKNKFTELNDFRDGMNKYLFSYILQAGFSYHITPAWSLDISPFYKQNLNSVFKNNYPVNQKFRSFGINFGLRIDL